MGVKKPMFLRRAKRTAANSPETPGATRITKSGGRSGAVLLLLFLCLATLARGADFWPFVPFPMYSYLHPSRPLTFRLEGMGRDGGLFPLSGDRYFRPYLRQDLLLRLSRLRPDEHQHFAALVLRLYENARRLRRHDGPELSGLRVSSLNLATQESRMLFQEAAP